MLRFKKTLSLILLSIFSTLSLTTISCSNNKSQNINRFSIKKDEKKDSWDRFVQREYVNQILDVIFDSDKEKIKEYKENQFNINEKELLNNLDKYLTYANNINSGYGSDGDSFNDDGPYPVRNFATNLNSIFSQNWLWTLFNLDKFNFVLHNIFNGFKANATRLGEEAEKNAVDFGLFRKIYSNNISQFVLEKRKSSYGELVYYNFYLLTEDWHILEINLEKTPKKPTVVKFLAYINTYPKLTKNKLDRDVFILDEYVNAVISVSRDRTSPAMNKFNAKFGGSPLRYVMFEVNSKYLNK
ncbi:aromatic motif membrane protein [Mycoplasma capricolum]|uniref:Lipoprotein n=1 Tax=Mycoplasma capricolum subsp. capricolum 14232 TaxID=1188238 RepID=A0A084EGH1_MYCCA|nr:aromatic motif membrane protein [Mycoplasma capricolum]KEZ17063.1 Hypothetical protein, predicted lipoprotein [Mycoplasma capricolum subsp. capricolum 14232]